MSKPVIAVATLLALAAGGYTVAWFKEANEFKARFIELAAHGNENVKPLLKNGEFIHYDSVDTSGFPFAVNLTVTKPVMNVPVDAILRLMPSKGNAPSKVPADFTWVEQVSSADSLVLSTNLIGSEFTMTANGVLNSKGTVNGTVRHSLSNEYSSPVICHLRTSPAGFLVNRPIFTDADSFLNVFHGADCTFSPGSLKDASNGTVLANTGKTSFSASNVTANGNRATSLKFAAEGTTYTPASDSMMNDMLQIVAEATGQTPQQMPYSFSEMGKVSANLDFAYNGPDNSAAFSDKNLKVNIDLNALNFTSSFINSDTTFHLSVAPEGPNRKGALALHSKTNISERYDQVLASQTKKLLEELGKTEGKSGKELEVAHDIANMGSPDALVNAILPKFHPLGDMTLDIDGTMQGPNEESTFLTQGHHMLNAFNVLTAPYGIKSNGEVIGNAGKSPTGKLSLTCINCDAMIKDVGNYIMRIDGYMDALHPDKKIAHANLALYDGIRVFAHTIALNGQDAAAKDLNFDVQMKDNGEFTVSGKPIMEVMQSYMANVTANVPVQPVPQQIPNESLPPLVRQPQP